AKRAIERDATEQRRGADDTVRNGGFGERRWERDADRGWGWGRERGDDSREYYRDDARRAFGRGSREETFGRSPREDDRVIGRGARGGGRVIERDRVIGRSPPEDGGVFGLSPRMNDWCGAFSPSRFVSDSDIPATI